MRRSEEAGVLVKGSGWTSRISLLAAGILAFWPGPAAGQAVTKIQGAKITVAGGANAGVRVGMTGTLCRKEQAGGRLVDHCPVAFEVVAVTAGAATLVVTKGDPSELSTEFRAKFRQPLVPGGDEVAAEPPRPQARPSARKELTDSRSGVRYLLVPGGSFTMGCTPGDTECASDEKPAHRVTLTRPYYVAETETTVGQYGAYARATGASRPASPGFAQGEDHPVVNVSWSDAEAFCRFAGGRLPTEAEWENAARGGREGNKYPWGNSISHDDANYGKDQCCGGATGGRDQWMNTSPAKSFSANGFGLYDMAGNVWEWVGDWYDGSYYGRSPSADPTGPSAGQRRVLRGGSWDVFPRYLRVSYRYRDSPDGRSDVVGFRCARDANP